MYLEKLSNAMGVSSAEDEIRKIIIEAIKPYADDWRIDTMGNLFVTRKAQNTENPLRVMVTAHMDEVGFMITKISSNGRLKFKSVGGFDPRVLLGKVLRVGKEKVPGVIGLKPVHLLSYSEYTRIGSIDSMYIDIGASGKSTGKVKVGDFATFATRYSRLGGQVEEEQPEDQGRVKGKAFDNRAGCAILLELLKETYPVDIIAVFTVQEELRMRGARVAAYSVQPDLAFILECTAADDLPPEEEDDPVGIPELGKGAAITIMDRSFIADARLVEFLRQTAEQENLPLQYKRPGIGGTDAGVIHMAREGIPSATISVPARYIHSPAAILDLTDFWNTTKLMQATLQRLPELER